MEGAGKGSQAHDMPLLGNGEPPPFVVHHPDGAGCGVVACDHASNRVPRALEQLGLPAGALQSHIAWDLGAAGVARTLAEALGLPLVAAGYSRLVVDCNRPAASTSCMPPISDGVLVPGNLRLDETARVRRLRSLYWPYHDEITARLRAAESDGRAAVLIAVHSFTPSMHRISRRMEIGVLWDRDPRIALPLMAALRADGVGVADNEPYSGRHPADFTVDHHGEREGRPCISIEVRQDLILDPKGQRRWGERLAQSLYPILDTPTLYTRRPNRRLALRRSLP